MSLSGNIARHDPARTKPHPRGLPLGRIGFLGLGDADFEADALELWGVHVAERGGDGFACSLGDAAALFLVFFISYLWHNLVSGIEGSIEEGGG